MNSFFYKMKRGLLLFINLFKNLVNFAQSGLHDMFFVQNLPYCQQNSVPL